MVLVSIQPRKEPCTLEQTRKVVLSKYDMHNRDLRLVFTRKEKSVIRPLGNCIILSIRSVKVILGDGEILVFNGESPKIQNYFIPFVIGKIEKASEDDLQVFEHLALEITLTYIMDKFQRRLEELDRTSIQILDKLNENKVKETTFEQLLHLKKRLLKLETQLRELEDDLTELVDDEEDLKDFHIQNPEDDTDNIESILENALESVEDIAHKTRELEENIDDAQEILTLKMNNIRNMVIKFDLLLTTITCFLALLAVVTGLYGMNVPNHNEGNSSAFWVITSTMFILGASGFGVLALWMRRKKII